MTPDEIAWHLRRGEETQGVEFKAPCSCNDRDKAALVKIVRAALGMANRRDGGAVIVGVDEVGKGGNKALTPTGLSPEQLSTWDHDTVSGKLSAYADPFLAFTISTEAIDGANLVVLQVEEFEEVPVLCKKGYEDILRKGACYVRTRSPVGTSEIPSQTEMRSLIKLATEKSLRDFIHLSHRAGLTRPSSPEATDDSSQFDAQRGDFR